VRQKSLRTTVSEEHWSNVWISARNVIKVTCSKMYIKQKDQNRFW